MPVVKVLLTVLISVLALVLLSSCDDDNSKEETTSTTREIILSTTAQSTTVPQTETTTENSGHSKDAIDTYIFLENNKTAINGSGADFSDGVLTITEPGAYSLRGTLSDGKIFVSTKQEDEKVKLYLNGVNISCSYGSAISVESSSEETVIYLAEGSINTLSSDGSDRETAVIHSKDDLQIEGTGVLSITAEYSKGILSEKDMEIKGGTINISSPDAGIKSRDGVEISDGLISLTCDGKGIDSADEVTVEGGTLVIFGARDYANLEIDGGTFIALGEETVSHSISADSDVPVYEFSFNRPEKSLTVITDENGNNIIGFEAPKAYSNVIFASDKVDTSKTYSVYDSGSFSSAAVNGIYTDGIYTAGELLGTLSMRR